MAALKSLTFTTLPTPRADRTLDRRARTIARLEEQKLLLKDPNYTRTVRTWMRKRREINCENRQRISPWWRMHSNGSYVLLVRSRLKPIEFEKGKTPIAVPSLDKLSSVIDMLIAAIRTGELDQQLAQSSKQATPKSKAAYDARLGGWLLAAPLASMATTRIGFGCCIFTLLQNKLP